MNFFKICLQKQQGFTEFMNATLTQTFLEQDAQGEHKGTKVLVMRDIQVVDCVKELEILRRYFYILSLWVYFFIGLWTDS